MLPEVLALGEPLPVGSGVSEAMAEAVMEEVGSAVAEKVAADVAEAVGLELLVALRKSEEVAVNVATPLLPRVLVEIPVVVPVSVGTGAIDAKAV